MACSVGLESHMTGRDMAEQRIFLDPERQREFDRDGFTMLPLLSPKAAAAARARLDALLQSWVPAIAGRHCHMSYTDRDHAYRKAVDALARELLGGPLRGAVQGYRIVSGGVFLKAPGSGEVGLHRDWTMTEDRAQPSFSLWCALDEADAANGTLHLIPGSHLVSDNIAGVGVPRYFSGYVEAAKARSMPIALRPGEAVAFDSRTLHWSPPNRSSRPRTAVQIVCLPASARHVYYVPDPIPGGERFELFEIADGASHEFTVEDLAGGARPGPSLGFVANPNRPLGEEEFVRRLAARAR